jgi:hypothetical protein
LPIGGLGGRSKAIVFKRNFSLILLVRLASANAIIAATFRDHIPRLYKAKTLTGSTECESRHGHPASSPWFANMRLINKYLYTKVARAGASRFHLSEH